MCHLGEGLAVIMPTPEVAVFWLVHNIVSCMKIFWSG